MIFTTEYLYKNCYINKITTGVLNLIKYSILLSSGHGVRSDNTIQVDWNGFCGAKQPASTSSITIMKCKSTYYS